MRLTASPGGPLRGEVRLPGDKSLSHRAALLGAVAEGQSRVDNFLVAGVTRAALGALSALGVGWRLEGTRLTVEGRGSSGLSAPRGALDCGGSATTLRLLAGLLAGAGVSAVLDGSPGLRRRPLGRLVEPLRAMGACLAACDGGRAPLALEARPAGVRLKGLDWRLPAASAQLKSALLLAGLWAEGPVTVREPGPSRDHTERLLAAMGASLERSDAQEAVTLQPLGSCLAPLCLALPGDFSSAAFLIVAAAITPGSDIVLRGVGLNPRRTGLLEALAEMGAAIEVEAGPDAGPEPSGDIRVRHAELSGLSVSGERVVRMIDEFPALAVAAAFARGVTTVRQAEELRLKESDRIGALCAELQALGAAIEERPDGFVIDGGRPLVGAIVQAHGDHRLAMALAVAGLRAEGAVTVEQAETIDESFPGFAERLRALGAQVGV